MKKKIGIYGGSFNPVHIGHCIMAEHFVQELHLHSCTFVPTNVSPFKQDIAPDVEPIHRLKMLRILVRGNSKFSVDDVELKRKGVSYTIDTIHHFKNKIPDADLFLLIGADQARDFTKWREWEQILTTVQLCIASRTNTITPEELQTIRTQLTLGANTPILLQSPLIEVSSSNIRNRINSHGSVRYMLPDKVCRYITKHRLYKGNT